MRIFVGMVISCVTVAGPVASEGTWDGLWRASPTASCVYTGGEGGALKIENDVLFGVENECRMTSPVNVRDMDALLYDMKCEGEGVSFTDRAMFMTASDGGLFLIWNGYAFKYDRCGDDAAIGTVMTADEIGITGAADIPDD